MAGRGKIVRAVPNLAGINAMMTSEGVRDALQAAGRRVVIKAEDIAGSPGFKEYTGVTHKKWVALTSIRATSKEAIEANIDGNVLLKALRSAGLHMSKGE